MTGFAANILLAAAWIAFTGRLDLANFLLGFVLGALILFFSRNLWDGARYFRRLSSILTLAGWSLVEIFSATIGELTVWWQRKLRLRRIELPIAGDSESEVALLSLLISLSPRTLVTGVSPDRQRLLVWAPAHRADLIVTRTARLLERHIRRVLR